ncbi:hypothetical protein, partial [Vibrio parahaemolyticus]|uniref:hypothetical protein n=1 Tax=Vibrio parahaemolyticus TaxID=670 RepID=UPI001C5F9323
MEANLKVIELNSLDRFRKDLLSVQSPEHVEGLLSWYLESFGGLNFKFGYDRPLIRARICKSPNGFEHVKELHSPPPELTGIGRMNDKGKPMFYAAHHL